MLKNPAFFPCVSIRPGVVLFPVTSWPGSRSEVSPALSQQEHLLSLFLLFQGTIVFPLSVSFAIFLLSEAPHPVASYVCGHSAFPTHTPRPVVSSTDIVSLCCTVQIESNRFRGGRGAFWAGCGPCHTEYQNDVMPTTRLSMVLCFGSADQSSLNSTHRINSYSI